MTAYFSCPFTPHNSASRKVAPVTPISKTPPIIAPLPVTPPQPVPPPTQPATPQLMPIQQEPQMSPAIPEATFPMPNMQPMMPGMMSPMPNMQPMMPGMMSPMPNMQYMMPDMQSIMSGMQPVMFGMDDMNYMGNYQPTVVVDRDPPPILSNNPPATEIVSFKELTAYPNYGNPSGNADILYTGNRGTWSFDLPPFLAVPGSLTARIIIRAVLDDHSNVPINRYSARITINGAVVHNGPVPLQHGIPAGGRFTNWTQLTFNVRDLRRNNRVEIQNTSTAGNNDWIAFDWMEMRFSSRR